MKLLGRIAIGILVLLVVLYGIGIGVLYFKQRDFQYDPTGEIVALSATTLVGAEQVFIPVEGQSVTAWFHPPTAGKPVILYYKGNAGSFTYEHERYERWVADGYGFVAFDYRGFPTSPGTISQEGMLADSIAVFDWAAAKGFLLVIWGRSIGTGPATYVASVKAADALLLETPFLSAANVAGERYPFAPIAWLMKDKFQVNEWIADVSEPVFVAHGTGDHTIDVSNGERVYALAQNKSELWIVPGADHNDLWDAGIWPRAETFFETAVAGI